MILTKMFLNALNVFFSKYNTDDTAEGTIRSISKVKIITQLVVLHPLTLILFRSSSVL